MTTELKTRIQRLAQLSELAIRKAVEAQIIENLLSDGPMPPGQLVHLLETQSADHDHAFNVVFEHPVFTAACRQLESEGVISLAGDSDCYQVNV